MPSNEFSIHEASHAVIAILLNLSFRYVFVGLNDCDDDGKFLQGGVCGLIAKFELAEELRIMALAGCVAQSYYEWARFKFQGIKPEFNTVQDLIQIRFDTHKEDKQIYARYLPQGVTNILPDDLNKTETMVTELWETITNVSDRLSESKTMTREEVSDCIVAKS